MLPIAAGIYRDWSLITGKGVEATKWEGGGM